MKLVLLALCILIRCCEIPPVFWYSDQKNELAAQLSTWQKKYEKQITKNNLAANSLGWLILPHAGYQYVGDLLTQGYLPYYSTAIDKIVFLAPLHSGITEIYSPECNEIKTVLGSLKVGKIKNFALKKLPQEHAFGNHLPFLFNLQNSIKNKPLVYPLFVGNYNQANLAELSKFITPKTLIIVSTDLSHIGERFNFTPAEKQEKLDQDILKAIEKLNLSDLQEAYEAAGQTVFGIRPLKLLVELLNNLPLINIELKNIIYDNSQNIAHDKFADSSVGYGVVSGQAQLWLLPEQDKAAILNFTKKYFKHLLNPAEPKPIFKTIADNLPNPYGVFVTIKNKGQLRGCLGFLNAYDKNFSTQLISRIKALADGQDMRFARIKLAEFPDLHFDVSVLMSPQATSLADFDLDDGIILTHEKGNAIYIPGVVREQGWDATAAFESLAEKAGLTKDSWQESKLESIKSVVIA
jgi:AmmeMemoRadiSam system protein B